MYEYRYCRTSYSPMLYRYRNYQYRMNTLYKALPVVPSTETGVNVPEPPVPQMTDRAIKRSQDLECLCASTNIATSSAFVNHRFHQKLHLTNRVTFPEANLRESGNYI
jgi:hypothetical protein